MQSPSIDGFIYVPSISRYVSKGLKHKSKNWFDAHQELHKEGYRMQTMPEFIEFIKYLRTGYSNRQEAEQILDEILTKRDPLRAEWLDADFKIMNNGLYINYLHESKKNSLQPKHQELLHSDTLMENKTPGINLEDWLNNPTSQGLPRSNIQNGSLWYWHPRSETVARFVAGSGRVDLSCNGDPLFSGELIGVRPSRA